MTDRPIVLASGSPQRKRLLAEAGYQFQIVVPEDREPNEDSFSDATGYVAHTAWLKAAQIAGQVGMGLVLAADTVVTLDGQIIGKPQDRADAERILYLLSGSVHQCLTGVCLWLKPENTWRGGVAVTELQMQRLSKKELNAYLDSNRWSGKAGAYGIQDPDPYVSIIRGSHSNVVGLPMELVKDLLESVR